MAKNVWSHNYKEQSDQAMENKEKENKAKNKAEKGKADNEIEKEGYFKPTLINKVNLERVTSLAGKFYVWKQGKVTLRERIKLSNWEKIQPPKEILIIGA